MAAYRKGLIRMWLDPKEKEKYDLCDILGDFAAPHWGSQAIEIDPLCVTCTTRRQERLPTIRKCCLLLTG
jgi:hypothetical protein